MIHKRARWARSCLFVHSSNQNLILRQILQTSNSLCWAILTTSEFIRVWGIPNSPALGSFLNNIKVGRDERKKSKPRHHQNLIPIYVTVLMAQGGLHIHGVPRALIPAGSSVVYSSMPAVTIPVWNSRSLTIICILTCISMTAVVLVFSHSLNFLFFYQQ